MARYDTELYVGVGNIVLGPSVYKPFFPSADGSRPQRSNAHVGKSIVARYVKTYQEQT